MQACAVGGGTGSQSCNSAGSGFTDCSGIISCGAGTNLQNGACVANVCTPGAIQACAAGNGTGSQACNSAGSGFSGCAGISSCNSGFDLLNGSCVAHTCIPGGDESSINAALSATGFARLCPGAVFNINNSINFSGDNQELSTDGLPTDATRAVININSPNLVTAVNGAGFSNIRIRHIIVNGGRPQFGFQPNPTTSLIEIGGNASGQVFDHVKAFEPRGWSTVHIAEGDVSSANRCSHATISNNDIGPAGQPDNTWADGISIGANSWVVGNTVTDATDGGIVIFQSPGTLVQSNTVISNSRVLLGGINLVDYAPYDGNFTGTVVTQNTILSYSGFIKIGIAMGPNVWGIKGGTNYGATVTNNRLAGANFGYGVAASGVSGFTINDNDFSASAYNGLVNPACDSGNAPPQAIVIDPGSSSGNFQGYSAGRVLNGICVSPQFNYSAGGLNFGVNQIMNMGSVMFAVLQADGNFVVYGAPGQALWASGTSVDCGSGQCRGSFQNDGNLVLYQNEVPYWSTNTAGTGAVQIRFSPISPYLQINSDSVVWQQY